MSYEVGAKIRVGVLLILLPIAMCYLLVDHLKPTQAQSQGIWIPTADMNIARAGHTATLLRNGKVLIAGGSGPNSSFLLNSAELYDPADRTWTATGSMRIGRTFHTATLLQDGRVLVAGGISDPSSLFPHAEEAEIYDWVTGTWSTGGLLPIPVRSHTATLLPDGRVLVAGGLLNSASSQRNTAQFYNPVSNSWSLSANRMNSFRAGHTATLLPTGEVLIAGGDSTSELYDIDNDSWGNVAPMGVFRQFHAATLLTNGKVLVAGGNSSQLYDIASNTWSNALAMQGSHSSLVRAELLPDGRVLVAGSSALDASSELYSPGSNSWSDAASMNIPRAGHTTTLLPNGDVLVAGGTHSVPGFINTIEASAELYTLNPDGSPGQICDVGPEPVPGPCQSVTVTKTFDTGPNSRFLALSREKTTLYVATRRDSGPGEPHAMLDVINTESGATVESIDLGLGVPFKIALLPERNRAYVAISSFSGDTVTGGRDRIAVVDTSNNDLMDPIDIGSQGCGPIGLAIHPDDERLYVTARASDSVYVINTTTGMQIAAIPVSFQLIGIAITPDGSRAYVAERSGDGANGTLHVISTSTNSRVATVPLGLVRSSSAAWLSITPDGKRAYVIYAGSNDPDNGFSLEPRVAVVDIDPTSSSYNTQIGIIMTAGGSGILRDITLAADGRLALVTDECADKVFIIDVDSSGPDFNTQVGAVTVSNPFGIAAPDDPGLTAYIINSGLSRASAISSLLQTTGDVVGMTGSNGWYSSDVTVMLNATNTCSSGVREITYSAVGAQAIASATASGSSTSFLITAEGITTVTYFATDNAGIEEIGRQLEIKIDRTPPALIIPGNVTANATGPAGAQVFYSVSATDNLDPSPVFGCVPPSGNIFPIGATPVLCTAVDVAGNGASLSFQVIVAGAEAQVSDLMTIIISFTLEHGITNSLNAKLRAVLNAINAGDNATACTKLDDLINQTNAFSGKRLTVDQAVQIIASANRIKSVLMCS